MFLRSEIRNRILICFLLGFSCGLQAETELEKASRLVKARNYQEAQVVLERVIQTEPRNADALAQLGELQLATQNPIKAIEYADKAILLDPSKSRYHVLRGNSLGMRAQKAGFLKAMTMVGDIRGAYEKAVQLEPANRVARLALFNFYFIAPSIAGGGLEKANAFAEQTLAHDGSRGHYMKGLILQKQKNPGAAQAEYRLALAADPQFAIVYNNLGYLELEMKQVDMALDHFRKQVELDPENANSYDSLGDGWMAKNHLDGAINSYRKALSLNPLFFASMRSLGKALEQAGRRDEAIQHYRHCAELGVQHGIPRAVTESKARLKALGVNE
jgi:tetratricopeptide (TPR) repeat protein